MKFKYFIPFVGAFLVCKDTLNGIIDSTALSFVAMIMNIIVSTILILLSL